MNGIYIAMVVVMAVQVGWYSRQVYRQEIEPTLATWLVFLLGTILSTISYLLSREKEIVSGVLIMADTLTVFLITASVYLFGKRKGGRLALWEKWYLVGIAVIVVYGLFSGDAFGSNLFTQILISSGYIPVVKKMVSTKTNHESFVGWICALVNGVLGPVPAIVSGNTLAVIYGARTVILVGSFLALMVYYERRKTR